jgi:hypothetical protein
MLVNTLRWRQEFNIDSLKTETFDPAIFGSLAHIYGKDKEGHPITYNVYGGNKDIKAVFGDVQLFVRYVISYRLSTEFHHGTDGGFNSWNRV